MRFCMRRVIFILSLWVLAVPMLQAQGVKFDYIFEEAVRQKLANNYDAAIDLFDYCCRLNPKSGAALYELADLYRYAKCDSLSIDALEKACQLFPDNYWYKNSLMTRYSEAKRNEDAQRVVEEMAQQFPNKSEVLMMLLGMYEHNNDYENMVKVLDKIELKEGKSEQLSMEKFRLFLQMKDEKRAFAEMEKLAEEYPNDLRYQVVIGDLYLDAGKKEEALKQFHAVEEKDPNNVTLLLSMSNFYQMEKEDSLYQQYLTRLLTNPSLDDATRTRMMGVLVYENLNQNADSTQLLTLFDKVLEKSQEKGGIIELKVRYMVTKKMPSEEVKPYLMKMLELDPENDMARQQLLAYAIEANDTMGIVAVCKPAVDYKVADPVFYYYLGVGYFQLDEKEKAVEAFRGGLERLESSTNENKSQLYINMYALMGDLYHSMGQDEEAFQAYDSCLVYKQNDAMVLNNYAYYLSLKKKDLNRAEEMSRQAIEQEPDNATYLDTYAWVLFQLKRYDEAKEYMDKVVELMEEGDEEMSDDIREHIQQINKKTKKK